MQTGEVYINCYVTDDSRMVWQPDILRIMTPPICAGVHVRATRRCGLLVDNEGTLHIDLHGARMRDGAVDIGRVRSHAER